MSEPLSWATEQINPASVDIDRRPVREVVDVILGEDAQVAAAVQAVSGSIAEAADLMISAIAAGGAVHYVGSGTSGRMGVLDAVELLPTYNVSDAIVRPHLAGGERAMMHAVEGAEDDAAAGADALAEAGTCDVVVGIAASGRTPFVRGALEEARRRGLPTVLIAANPEAPLAPLADVAILVATGPEVVTGSTRMKAATAQKMILNTLSTATMIKLGKTYSNLMIDMLPTNEKLRRRSVRMLAQGSGRPETECAQALQEADGSVRVALVALLAGVDVEAAAAALQGNPPAAARTQDPSGIRTAVEALR